MGWLADCSESERASVLAKLAGRAYLSEKELKATEKTLKMQRSKAKFIKDGDAEAWVFVTSDDAIIVSCRGTEPTKFADIAADLKTIPVRHPRNGMVHSGFYEYANLVYDEIYAQVKKMRKKKENVFVVGHSLGGAMAVLVAEQLAADGIPVKELRTFGQPRVGTREFLKLIDFPYYRYRNNNDLVTVVPPTFFNLIFKHSGVLRYINTYGNIRKATYWQRFKDKCRGNWEALKSFNLVDGFADHSMGKYHEYLGNMDESGEQLPK